LPIDFKPLRIFRTKISAPKNPRQDPELKVGYRDETMAEPYMDPTHTLRASAVAVGSRHMIDTCHGIAQALHKDRLSLADVTSEVRGKSVGN
jgi:hypothetical protein